MATAMRKSQPPASEGRRRAVVSAIGRDRPGIINELSELAAELDLNIDDSRMTGLGEEFAVLMSLTGSERHLAAFESRLQAFAESKGFSTLFPSYRRAGTADRGTALPG